MNAAFVSHTSVRIKGTENNYEPVNCSDPKCTKTWPHMHCPFCVKSETFQDPVILKAHYRVKHVDKGIDFAGLKILRCCEHCDIVGTIKGTKEFKGAHWHCYKCRNGFTRRDEAIKHYRTHFRNPSTTFQIQVAQDINQSVNERANKAMKETSSAVDSLNSGPHEMTFVETVVTTMSSDNSTTDVEITSSIQEDIQENDGNKSSSGDMQVSVAANETVGPCEGQTIMIIPTGQNDQSLRSINRGEVVHTIETTEDLQTFYKQQKATIVEEQNSNSPSVLSLQDSNDHWSKEKESLLQQIAQLKSQVSTLTTEKAHTENHYKSEIDTLKMQLQVANSDIASYQRRESELLNQLKIPLGDRLSSLLVALKQQHEELLHQQLAQLRQEYLQQQLNEEFQRSSDMEADQVVRVDVASLVQADSADSVPHMIVEENNHQVVLSQDSYSNISASVLTSQALITEGSPTPTQLFVVPNHRNLQVKAEEHSQESDVEEVYQEELDASGSTAASAAGMEFTHPHVENEIVTTATDSESVILLQTPDNNSSDAYDGVSSEQLEITAEGSDQVLTLQTASSSSNKRAFEEDSSDMTNVHKHKQRKEL